MKLDSNWALEYKHAEHKRKREIRISFWAFIALLIFVLLLVLFLGSQTVVTLLGKI